MNSELYTVSRGKVKNTQIQTVQPLIFNSNRNLDIDPVTYIVFGFLGFLALLGFAAICWLRRVEGRISRTEQRLRQDQIIADQELEQARRESIWSILPCKPFLESISLKEPGTIISTSQSCPICLEVFIEGVEISWSKNAECIHVFHKTCVTNWFMRNDAHICPMCRCDFLIEVSESLPSVNSK